MDFTIRKARIADAEDIQKIVNKYAEEGKMLPKSIADIHEQIQSFFVAEAEGKIIGCCCLQPYYPAMGEIRSLAVMKEFTGKGIGTSLVVACLEEAKKLGMKEAFTFTYVPEFFQKLHFKPINREKIHPKLWIECMRCPKYPDCDEHALRIILK
jgi:amino-acid N-acetyltransferase